MKVAVVGGGIAGLAAAWELRNTADVWLFEPSELGGCIRTTPFMGKPIDEGADSFITRVPEGIVLCRELGIESELIAPAAGDPMIWWDGQLRKLPDGLVIGVPTRLVSLLTAGILSPSGVVRAACDLVLPRRGDPRSMTVRELIAGRFGVQVADRLVEPLVGSINAGWTGQLGAAEVTPQLVSTAERSRSMLVGLRSMGTESAGPVFLAPKDGMGCLVTALVQQLERFGTQVLAHAVDSLRTVGSRVLLEPIGDEFDAVVLATPARTSAAILAHALGGRPRELVTIPTASVALVTAAIQDVRLPPHTNGFLVPRASGWLMTACSFGSSKWPQWKDDDLSIVRMSAGRYGDDSASTLDDQELSRSLLDDLGAALGKTITPVETKVSRWPDAFPQYGRGHLHRVSSFEDSLSRCLPSVTIAGSSYRGIGIPACISSGRRAAKIAIYRSKALHD